MSQLLGTASARPEFVTVPPQGADHAYLAGPPDESDTP